MANGKRGKHILSGLAMFLTFAPQTASALTLVHVAELFNIFVGLVLTLSLLLFFGGLWVYFTRLGTWPNNRDQALAIMEWGVAVLFVLIVILAIVRFFQEYPKVMTTIAGILLAAVIAGLIVYVVTQSKSEKKESH